MRLGDAIWLPDLSTSFSEAVEQRGPLGTPEDEFRPVIGVGGESDAAIDVSRKEAADWISARSVQFDLDARQPSAKQPAHGSSGMKWPS